MPFAIKANDRTCRVKFKLFCKLPTQTGPRGDPRNRGDVRTAKDAASCWIYLFQDRPGGSKVFSHEIYADENGGYRHVDLKQHHEKDDRPLAADPAKSILLPSAEMIHGRRVCVGYWVLLSPFQLYWSRLPDLGPNRTLAADAPKKRHDDFVRWTKEDRDLEYLTFAATEDCGGALRYLWTTWQLPIAYQVPYSAARAELCHTIGTNMEFLTLHQIVKGMIKEPRLASNINQYEFRQAGKVVEKARARLEETAKPLADAIQSRPYQELMLDMWVP
jgi:hypothetical protein